MVYAHGSTGSDEKSLMLCTEENFAGLIQQPGKVFPNEECRLVVEFETNFDGIVFQKENGIDSIAFSEGMEAILSTGDYGWNAQHAAAVHSGEFVLEVAADHVAEFAHRVPDLTFGIRDLRAEHTGGDLSGSFGTATHGEDATEGPGKADHCGEVAVDGLRVVFCRTDSAAQHDLEHFLRGQLEDRQPVLRMRVNVRG